MIQKLALSIAGKIKNKTNCVQRNWKYMWLKITQVDISQPWVHLMTLKGSGRGHAARWFLRKHSSSSFSHKATT